MTLRRLITLALKSAAVAVGAVVILVGASALFFFIISPRPTDDQVTLAAIKAEAKPMIATHPIHGSEIPKSQWPAAIASLKPFRVTAYNGDEIEILMRPGFDGGWGYTVPQNKRDLSMLMQCYSDLGQGVYWHGPC